MHVPDDSQRNDAKQPDDRHRMRIATIIFAVATFFSRIAGMIRVMAANAIFGVKEVNSAFTIAVQIPNLIRSLVADSALSAAFVPVVSQLQENDEHERARRLTHSLATLIWLSLGTLTVLSMWLAPHIVDLFISDAFSGFDLAVDLTRIMMPIVVLMGFNGLVVGILNANDKFGIASAAPIAWNLVILAALWAGTQFGSTEHEVYWYAWGTLAGTIVQVAMPLPQMQGIAGRLRISLNFRDPKIKEILILMLPVTISLGLINLQLLINTAFSTHIPGAIFPSGVSHASGPSVLEGAFRIYMLPQGIFSVGISTVFFPMLARLAARNDMVGFREHVANGLRQILLLLVPSAALIVALNEPIVRLLYERGKFDPPDTLIVAATLTAFSFGLVFNGASLLLIRSFFSIRRPWIPTLVSVLTLIVNVIADWLLYKEYGVVGIAAATSIVNVVGFGVMYVLLRNATGALGTMRTAAVTLAAVTTAAIGAVAGWGVWNRLEAWLGVSTFGQIAALFPALFVALAIYGVLMVRLGFLDRHVLRLITGRSAPEK